MSDHVDIIAAIMATEKELLYEELNCILNEQSEPLFFFSLSLVMKNYKLQETGKR